jgi:hypothetical protein
MDERHTAGGMANDIRYADQDYSLSGGCSSTESGILVCGGRVLMHCLIASAEFTGSVDGGN